MTQYQVHLGHHPASLPWTRGQRRTAAARRTRTGATPVRISASFIVAVILEVAILVGTVVVVLGIGSVGSAGAFPTPAPAPSYAPAAPAQRQQLSGPDAPLASAALPAPLPAPAPLAAPASVR